jgi:hypothetical protein
MEFLHQVLLFLHLIGMAVLVAAFLLQRRTAAQGPLNPAWLHGAGLQLVTGLALVGVIEVQRDDVDHAKVGVKLLVALVITVLALVQRRRDPGAALPSWLVPSLAGLVVLNLGVAVFWQ